MRKLGWINTKKQPERRKQIRENKLEEKYELKETGNE
jgi:hypothetical protein